MFEDDFGLWLATPSTTFARSPRSASDDFMWSDTIDTSTLGQAAVDFNPFAITDVSGSPLSEDEHAQTESIRQMSGPRRTAKIVKQRKPYEAPKGVWKTPTGAYISTIYIANTRFYGPVRASVEIASLDRRVMDEFKMNHPNDKEGIAKLVSSLKESATSNQHLLNGNDASLNYAHLF